ncbi:MAG: M28 family peptidase [Verrucomicrobia bacterium]|nr:M28 family peptidase [Verrucomicrobiota bacterium]
MAGVCSLLFALAAASGAAGASPSHAFLERLCDDFGPRLTGSAANAAALDALAAELRSLGYAPEKVPFELPGWERGDDRVELLAPFARRLRIAALCYSQAHEPFEAEVADLGNGRPEDQPRGDLRGRVGLLASTTPLQTSEIVARAESLGLRAILFINREGGGQLLARTGSFQGRPLPLPIYSLAQEEGRWLARLLARGTPVRVRVATASRCVPATSANLVVRIPGRVPSRLIVGAHFDSWDLGQGAMDNGIGIAQLHALALALRGTRPHHTLELIWFNGEEQGLWGSRAAAAALGDTPVVALLNLDMVGVPIGVNALGDDSLVPALERWHRGRGEPRRLPKGVENLNWLASDHTPYQLAGVRTLTFNGPIPRDSVRYYHDLADTIDKVPPALIEDSAAIIIDLVRTLAADTSLSAWRRPAADTEKLFTRFGLEKRLRTMGLWPPPSTP